MSSFASWFCFRNSLQFQFDVAVRRKGSGFRPSSLQVEAMGSGSASGRECHASQALGKQPVYRGIEQPAAMPSSLELRQNEKGHDVASMMVGDTESDHTPAFFSNPPP